MFEIVLICRYQCGSRLLANASQQVVLICLLSELPLQILMLRIFLRNIDVEDILEKDVSTGGSSQPASSHAGRAQGRGQRNMQVGGLVQFGCEEIWREKNK